MPTIAVADLHDHTSEVLQQVADDRKEYVVTQQGRPIARLLPVAAEPVVVPEMDAWRTYSRTAEALRRAWPADHTSQSVLDDVRRR